jgi:hypothetical protein
MNRRTTLKLAGATLLAVPAWIAWRRFAPLASPLDRALEQAAKLGKPLLVLVVPDDPDKAHGVAYLLSSAYETGGEELRADLALAEVACATRAQIERHVGGVAADATAGLIERDSDEGGGGRPRWVDVPLRPREPGNVAVLRAALAGNAETVARRARDARAALGTVAAEVERRLERGEDVSLELADRAAAIVRERAKPGVAAALLAAAAERRLWTSPPRGARWASESGCAATEIEYLARDSAAMRQDLQGRLRGDPPLPKFADGTPIPLPWRASDVTLFAVACGMAMSNEDSNRFLFFYTDDPT